MKSAFFIVASFLLAACGGTASSQAPQENTAPVPEKVAEEPQPQPEEKTQSPKSSSPTLSLDGEEIAAVSLPAVSKDGSKLAYLEQYEDGMSGILNARLVVLDTSSSKPVEEISILNADEYNDISEIEGDIPAILDTANKYLATDTWSTMVVAELGNIPSEAPQPIKAGDVSITFKDGKLTVNEKSVPVKVADSCGEPYLAFAALGSDLVLVNFEYEAGGECELPGPQFQVVSGK